ncbi:MAG: rhodanese-like domain-containing protein [Ectothiorhodospiraceae bacterium]
MATMTQPLQQLADEARQRVTEVSPAEARERIRNGAVVLDVRDREEFEQGHIEGAVNISRGTLEMRIMDALPDPETPIVCHCAAGKRGALAADTLQRIGYRNVVNLAGGLQAYRSEVGDD